MADEINHEDFRCAADMEGPEGEARAVIAAIKAEDVLYRDVSDYLLRTIVTASIRALDEHRATRDAPTPA